MPSGAAETPFQPLLIKPNARPERGRRAPEPPFREPAYRAPEPDSEFRAPQAATGKPTLHIYSYWIGQNRLREAAHDLGVSIAFSDTLEDADVVLTIKNYYRKRPQPIAEAESRGIPVYVLRSNTASQMTGSLADIFGVRYEEEDEISFAMRETQEGIQRVLASARPVELSPQNAFVRRQQHQLIRAANLVSHSHGKEPRRRIKIYANSNNN